MHVTRARARVSLKTNDVNCRHAVTSSAAPHLGGFGCESECVTVPYVYLCIRTKTRYTITQFEIRV